jgi:Rrf2 family nitric oxide-sensitive transcriptional repressor
VQLTRFTDFALRVLMYLSVSVSERTVTVTEIAENFDVSRHHLNKVVQFLAQRGWVVTTRGKGGGLALAHPPEHYKLGHLIRTLEGGRSVIDCSEPLCALNQQCGLKPLLDEAMSAFFSTLDSYTLADTLSAKTYRVIKVIQRR